MDLFWVYLLNQILHYWFLSVNISIININDIIFVDVAKAFDSVDQSLWLLHHLYKNRLREKLVNCISDNCTIDT